MKNLFQTKRIKFKEQRIKTIGFSFLFSLTSFLVHSQEKTKDSTNVKHLDEVLVSGVRVTKQTPIAFNNVSKEEIAKRNLGQDIPILLNYLPSVVTTSDAGNGFGYTGIRVRGSDATRVNVTINGIPYNDAESSGTYFVDLPDFASSLQSIQLQRGVGTSTNGAGAFGASLNMLTDSYVSKASAEFNNSYGSFNSRKNTVKFSTGLLNDHFELAGRISDMHSDGYIDRASSNMQSYYLQGTYICGTTLIKALAFGGKEKTYQAWYGINKATLETNPTYNEAGVYTDMFGQIRFYPNETDNYTQSNFQLHWNERLSNHWHTNLSLHYTKGKGYYESYYSVPKTDTTPNDDSIARDWLDNNFYGTTFSAKYDDNKTEFIYGGAYNKYEGGHYGNIIWARNPGTSQPEDKVYDNYGNKQDFNTYAKVNHQLGKHLILFGDVQFRNVGYQADGVADGAISKVYNFVNPKAGLTYKFSDQHSLYGSFAVANREPTRADFGYGSPKSEHLNDYELGWRMSTKKAVLNTNLYYMNYKDQLVNTGLLNNMGYEIHSNVPHSYRAGGEIEATLALLSKLSISPNITLSTNKIKDLKEDTGNGTVNYGNQNIAYSPNMIAGTRLNYKPMSNLEFILSHKYVDEQYVSNFNSEETKLKSYSIVDFNAVYELKTKKVFKSIVFTGLVNNVFNTKYVSNAYVDSYSSQVKYFPQAGINVLGGVNLKF